MSSDEQAAGPVRSTSRAWRAVRRGAGAAVLTIGAAAAVPLAGTSALANVAVTPAVAAASDTVLSAVDCHHLSSCWAVGYRGTTPSYGGTLAERWSASRHSWRRVHTPNPSGVSESSFNGVSCGARSSCMAVGAKETAPPSLHVSALTEHWNGHHWSIKALPHPSRYPSARLWAVSCPTATYCFAVGSYVTHRREGETHVLIERWNGHHWSVISSPGSFDSSELFGVSCAATTSCQAVGDDIRSEVGYPLSEKWNGASWSLLDPRATISSSAIQLDGVSCGDATDCLAVGRYDLNDHRSLERTLAQSWVAPVTADLMKPPNPSPVDASELWSDSCTTSTSCMAVGQAETNRRGSHWRSLAEQWNGTTWTTLTTPAIGTSKLFRFLAVSCPSASDCFAVGDNEVSTSRTSTVAERWNGHHWKRVASQS